MLSKIAAFYDDLAPRFDDEQDSHSFLRDTETKILHDVLSGICRPEFNVLEIGAGTGRFTEFIAPRVKSVTAIDCSGEMLRLLERRMEQRDIGNVTAYHSDFLAHTFDRRYDLVVSFSAIEYFGDKEAFFTKVGEVSLPSATLVFTTARRCFFRFWGQFGNLFRQGVLLRAYGVGEMRRRLERIGFQPLELSDHCMKTPFSRGILMLVHAHRETEKLGDHPAG